MLPNTWYRRFARYLVPYFCNPSFSLSLSIYIYIYIPRFAVPEHLLAGPGVPKETLHSPWYWTTDAPAQAPAINGAQPRSQKRFFIALPQWPNWGVSKETLRTSISAHEGSQAAAFFQIWRPGSLGLGPKPIWPRSWVHLAHWDRVLSPLGPKFGSSLKISLNIQGSRIRTTPVFQSSKL